ncbi:MAG: class I SAM-dependent methyltransferase [Myxococcota bacterium]
METVPYRDNERWWSERASFHLATPMYAEFVQRLRDGADALLPFDDHVLGDVTGLDILHLQCHVGTDTLSLARRGATVTGLDFSEEALAQARGLGRDLGLAAEFVHGNAVALPETVRGPYDVVYTSYGALCWLHDLQLWAAGIAARLRPGGRLIVIDCHPLWRARASPPFDERGLVLQEPCLSQPAADAHQAEGSYADPEATTRHNTAHDWWHGIGSVLDAVLRSGLVLEHFEEHPESYYQGDASMVRGDDRLWRLPEPHHGRYPLTFSLVARAPR